MFPPLILALLSLLLSSLTIRCYRNVSLVIYALSLSLSLNKIINDNILLAVLLVVEVVVVIVRLNESAEGLWMRFSLHYTRDSPRGDSD